MDWGELLKAGVGRAASSDSDDTWRNRYTRLLDAENTQVGEYLGVASQVEFKLKREPGKFENWLNDMFSHLKVDQASPLLRALWKMELPIITTNYDHLLCPDHWTRCTWRDTADEIMGVTTGEIPGVFHIHGEFQDPKSVIFGYQSYERVLSDKLMIYWKKYMRGSSLVMLGLKGTAHDPNIAGLIGQLSGMSKVQPVFRLRRAEEGESVGVAPEVTEDGVRDVVYGESHDDLGNLMEFIATGLTAPPSDPWFQPPEELGYPRAQRREVKCELFKKLMSECEAALEAVAPNSTNLRPCQGAALEQVKALKNALGEAALPGVHLSRMSAAYTIIRGIASPWLEPLIVAIECYSGAFLDRLPAYSVFRDEAEGPRMVVLPAGEYAVGTANLANDDDVAFLVSQGACRDEWVGQIQRDDDEGPIHVASLHRYAVSSEAVTRSLYTRFSGCECPELASSVRLQESSDESQLPVTGLSWLEAREFCSTLSATLTGDRTVYRLPTEREWEAACRARSLTAYPWGNDVAGQPFAGFDPRRRFLHQVGSFPPNAFGLYDMIGNVWEWTLDQYSRAYESRSGGGASVAYEPKPDNTLVRRVCRGGAWDDDRAGKFRSGYRETEVMTEADNSDVGIRLVRTLPRLRADCDC